MIHSELAAMANRSPLIRSYLGIPDNGMEVKRITENSVHFDLGGGMERAVFFTKRKFRSEKTTNHMIRLIEEGVFEQAFRSLGRKQGAKVWEDYYSRKLMPTKQMGKMAFLTAIPDAGSGGSNTTCDGRVVNAVPGSTFSDIRNGSGTSAASSEASGAFARLISGGGASQWDEMAAGVFAFDLSSVGGGTVESGSLFLTALSSSNSFGGELAISSHNLGGRTTLLSNDFRQILFSAFSDDRATHAGWLGEVEFSLNASGVSFAQIAAMGNPLALCTLTNFHLDNSEPTWAASLTESFSGYFSDNGSLEPRLELAVSRGSGIPFLGNPAKGFLPIIPFLHS